MTRLEAINKALFLLGVEAIQSPDQDIKAARVMNFLFPSIERAVLSEFPWPFALRLAELSPSSVPPPPGWLYTFKYPKSVVMLYQVYLSSVVNYRPSSVGNMRKARFIVQDNVICTVNDAVAAEFTVLTCFIKWPSLVAEALAARLAYAAAASLVGGQSVASELLKQYGILFSIAKDSCLNEENAHDCSFGYSRSPSHYTDVR